MDALRAADLHLSEATYREVLTLAGEQATLRYHLERIDGDTVHSYNYVDTFVWRDHRWQATSSHQVK